MRTLQSAYADWLDALPEALKIDFIGLGLLSVGLGFALSVHPP